MHYEKQNKGVEKIRKRLLKNIKNASDAAEAEITHKEKADYYNAIANMAEAYSKLLDYPY